MSLATTSRVPPPATPNGGRRGARECWLIGIHDKSRRLQEMRDPEMLVLIWAKKPKEEGRLFQYVWYDRVTSPGTFAPSRLLTGPG